MALATNGGHVSRAVDFFKAKDSMYFAIGGKSMTWDDPSVPTSPSLSDFRLHDIVGLKKVDNIFIVIQDDSSDDISYRNQNWRKVARSEAEINITTTTASTVPENSNTIPVNSLEGLGVGKKVRIHNLYEGIITNITASNIELDTPAPANIPAGSTVVAGAFVEGAKYVYVDCFLNYDEFPTETYRQIGLMTGVTPNTQDKLYPANPPTTLNDDYTSLGVLEILDNRIAATRNANQREQISLIIEF